MKALYYPDWGKLEIADLAEPDLKEEEVLIRVANCGVCGSELETFRMHSLRRTPPLIMGHEFCGLIEKVQAKESTWTEGQRVIAHAVVHCGDCEACLRGDTNLCSKRQIFGMNRPGGFAELVAVPQRVLIPWPEGLSSTAAVLTEPLANGINAMRQAQAARKSRVLVIGAGPIGLMCVFAAKQLYGASVIVSDLIPERLEAARLVGADKTIQAGSQDLAVEAEDFWSGCPAQFVIDAVGSSATKRASIELVEHGGAVVWLGLHEDVLQFNSYLLTLGQKTVSGSYSGSFEDFQRAAKLLASKKLNTSWISQYSLLNAETGFRDMLSGSKDKIKAVLNFDGYRA